MKSQVHISYCAHGHNIKSKTVSKSKQQFVTFSKNSRTPLPRLQVSNSIPTFNKHPVECCDVEEHGEEVEYACHHCEHVCLYLWSQF